MEIFFCEVKCLFPSKTSLVKTSKCFLGGWDHQPFYKYCVPRVKSIVLEGRVWVNGKAVLRTADRNQKEKLPSHCISDIFYKGIKYN